MGNTEVHLCREVFVGDGYRVKLFQMRKLKSWCEFVYCREQNPLPLCVLF